MAIDMVRFVERLKTELRLATPSHACVPAIYGSSAWQPWGELSGIRGFLEHKVENVRHPCARQIGAGRRVSYESAAIWTANQRSCGKSLGTCSVPGSDRKSTRLTPVTWPSRMPSSA